MGQAGTVSDRRALIFDLGGVVIDWSPRYLFDKLLPDAEQVERFLAEVCPPWWNIELDRGRPFEQAVRERSEEYPEWAPYIEAYWRRWAEMLGGPMPGMPELITELRAAGAPLYAITNWSAETFPLARDRYPLLGVFDGARVVSGEVGLVKPDPEIFELALRRFGLSRENCLFIDDNEPNVVGARQVGIAATRFVDEPTLRAHPDIAAHLSGPRK
jgi:2-haloacid dehalogenase